jgi:adenylate kinase
MRLVLVGPPGSGKGTQAKMLSERLNLPHIATGDILRYNVSKGTPLGKKAQDFMNKGVLVPDKVVTEMLRERFQLPDVENGFILDGYPRNINQAKALGELLKSLNMEIHIVIHLDTTDALSVERLTGHLVCMSCGANYHIKFMPPKVEKICNRCQGILFKRSDDREDVVRKRLEVYRRDSSALLDYYTSLSKLRRVPAEDGSQAVFDKILSLVANA